MGLGHEKVEKDKMNSDLEDYSPEQRENAFIFDKIYKKSQYIGTW